MKNAYPLLASVLLALLLAACSKEAGQLHDGYYTAEAKHYDKHGWKKFLTIYVFNNKIVTVDYNARNSSGFIKSWDIEYMRRMQEKAHTYPTKYTRAYAAELLDKQDPGRVRPIPGARHSHLSFQKLAAAAIAQAVADDKHIVFIELPNIEDEER